MRNHKNNITSSVKNITLNLQNITPHFTGKEKIITLVSAIIMLSFTNITLCSSNIFNSSNVSALSYSSSVDIGFTFNPTLSLNISSSDLIISNLTPGTTDTSNEISVNISTNSAYGYTLSAGVSNNNLVHSNNTDIFSNIATTANLPSLITDNTWGYSTSLDNGVSWSNYNGLSSNNNTELISTNYKAQDIMNFKIAARASSVQPSGTYTNTITFYAVTKPAVITLLDAYKAVYPALEQKNGYYKMQDMTPEICSAVEETPSDLQVIDIRDDKVYWIAKLAYGHCWMTQNLDFDIDSTKTYTSYDTDLGYVGSQSTWKPSSSTISFTGDTVPGWKSNLEPFSADPGDIYYYTSNSDANDIRYNSLQECINAGHTDCAHYHAGNYYNWVATMATNNTSNLIQSGTDIATSVCPAGWRLPSINNNEFSILLAQYGVIDNQSSTTYTANGFNMVRQSPLYFVRAGGVEWNTSNILNTGINGVYRSSTITSYYPLTYSYFNASTISPAYYNRYPAAKQAGATIRCIAR